MWCTRDFIELTRRNSVNLPLLILLMKLDSDQLNLNSTKGNRWIIAITAPLIFESEITYQGSPSLLVKIGASSFMKENLIRSGSMGNPDLKDAAIAAMSSVAIGG